MKVHSFEARQRGRHWKRIVGRMAAVLSFACCGAPPEPPTQCFYQAERAATIKCWGGSTPHRFMRKGDEHSWSQESKVDNGNKIREGIGVQRSLNVPFANHCDCFYVRKPPVESIVWEQSLSTVGDLADGPWLLAVFDWCTNEPRKSRGSMMVWNEDTFESEKLFWILSPPLTRCETTG